MEEVGSKQIEAEVNKYGAVEMELAAKMMEDPDYTQKAVDAIVKVAEAAVKGGGE